MKIPCFFVSEIAALIGKNKYKTESEALRIVWKRNNPIEYEQALKLSQQEDKEEAIEKVLVETGATELLNKILNDSTDEKKQIECLTKTIQKQGCLQKISKKMIQEVQKEVVSKINKKRGIDGEEGGIGRYEKKYKRAVTKRNDQLYRYEGKNFIIAGKIDGINEETNTLIEHKHRRNRLFNWVPAYEKIQILTYLKLTSLSKAQLVQDYQGEIKVHDILWSEDDWKKIDESLEAVAKVYLEMMENQQQQISFLRSKV